MKNFTYILCILILFSCNNEEKIQGKWTLDFFETINIEEYLPVSFFVENDSIKFTYGEFDHYHKFKIDLSRNKFIVNDKVFKFKIKGDTLVINKELFYIRDNFDSLKEVYYGKPILNLDLPKFQNTKWDSINRSGFNQYIYFGKRKDNGEYGLQLNDKYAEISELRLFLNQFHSSLREELIPRSRTYLFIDKSTPLKYFDLLMDELKIVGQLKIGLINNININFIDNNFFYYNFEVLTKRLSSPYFDSKYKSYLNDNNLTYPPPPPPAYPYPPNFDIENSEIEYFFLINNDVYYNQKLINDIEFSGMILDFIEKKKVIFSLYDLNSEFSAYLKMNAIIDNSYNDFYNKKAENLFSKPYNELNREQTSQIKLDTKKRFLWDYSIPHYLIKLRNKKSEFSRNLKPIDSLLPKSKT